VTELVLESTVERNAPDVILPVFSGPLDLLLHLIQKQRISIYDIPIALICDQYHGFLRAVECLDLEIAADFMWMASWLLELKSKMLLPRRDESEPDPRQELVERLLEYRRHKELAAELHEREVIRRCMWESVLRAEVEPGEEELDLDDVDLRVLASVYLDVMRRFAASHPPPLEVAPLRHRVEDTMGELYRRVVTEGLVALLRHLHSKADIDEVVVLVVAALELVRMGGICAEQSRPFAEIYLRPGRVHLDLEHLLQSEAARGT